METREDQIVIDALEPRFGPESLRYSLIGLFCLLLWAAAHFQRAEGTFVRDHEDPVAGRAA